MRWLQQNERETEAQARQRERMAIDPPRPVIEGDSNMEEDRSDVHEQE